MPALHDLIYVALFAAVGPLLDYSVFWPAYRRLAQADPTWARRWLWASAIGQPWMLVAYGAAIWIASDRSWTLLGFTVTDGWRLWGAIALVLLLVAYHVYAVAMLARSADARESVRRQFGQLGDTIMPHTRSELFWFSGVSLTAGFCEEFLFRGYFIWALAPWLGWWGAATLSLLIFALGHLYQGWNGVLRTGIVGAFFTLVVAIFASLWPAIALHALVDLGAGVMAWLALRGVQTTGEVPEVEKPAEPQSAPEVLSRPILTEPPSRPTDVKKDEVSGSG